MKYLLIGFILTVMGFNAKPVFAEVSSAESHLIEVTVGTLAEFEHRKPHKLKNMNLSVQKTGAASRMIVSGRVTDETMELLSQAIKHYPENTLAYFIKAWIYDQWQYTEKANEWYERFLLKSKRYSEFEEKWVTKDRFHGLRRVVYNKLDERGYDYKKKKQNLFYIPNMKERMRSFFFLSGDDEALNIAFFCLIIVGGISLIFSGMAGANFNHPILKVCLPMYVMVWLCYALWVFDMFAGLPWGLNRKPLVFSLIGISSFLLIGNEVIAKIKNYYKPVGKNEKRCPQCREILSTVILECPYCQHSFKRDA